MGGPAREYRVCRSLKHAQLRSVLANPHIRSPVAASTAELWYDVYSLRMAPLAGVQAEGRMTRVFGILKRVQSIVKPGLQAVGMAISHLTKPTAHGPVLAT